MSILTTKRNDMCYCPGCSHGMVLELIGKTLDRLGRTAENVCIVSDIGCIGTADRYFDCHTFHGLHGRSITYAEGIKRVQPDLLTVVLIGDGGCGIGTGHLVHAARRNADIKVIVCNNFNFGMTGGQHSPTTPIEARTTTTPHGASEQPFDVCATVAVNGAAYVARCNVFDRQTEECLHDALHSEGFTLLDIWELCTAYFVPANRMNRAGLAEQSKRLRLTFGVVPCKPRVVVQNGDNKPDDSFCAARMAKRRDVSVKAFDWPRRREICVAGSAGQRIKSAVGIVGEIAVAGGLHAAEQDDFPITVRKGFSLSNLILSNEPIRYTGVDAPDLAIVLSSEGGERLVRAVQLRADTTLVAGSDVALPDGHSCSQRLELNGIAKRVGKESTALAVLCACLFDAGYFDPREFLANAHSILKGPYRDANLAAIEAGATLAESPQSEAALSGSTLGDDHDS